MNLFHALLELAFRSSFACAIGNVLAVLVFITLIVVLPAWTIPLLFVALLTAFGLLNGRAFKQLYYEAHGCKALGEGRNPEAEAYFRKSLALAQSLRKNDPARSRLLEWLSTVTDAQGKHDEAEFFARDWLDHDEKTLGSDHLRTVAAMQNLAAIYCVTARYPQALPLLEKALSVRESRPGIDRVGYGMCLHWLGAVMYGLHEHDKAATFLSRASAVLGEAGMPDPTQLPVSRAP